MKILVTRRVSGDKGGTREPFEMAGYFLLLWGEHLWFVHFSTCIVHIDKKIYKSHLGSGNNKYLFIVAPVSQNVTLDLGHYLTNASVALEIFLKLHEFLIIIHYSPEPNSLFIKYVIN